MSTIIASNISDGTTSVPSTYVVNGSAKAWVNFNGTSTVAIRDSLNVGSITDVGTGQYRVNFTNAMPDANYSVIATVNGADTGTYEFNDSRHQALGVVLSPTYASVSSKHPAATAWYDVWQMSAAIFS